jgi:hypothetical protein
MVRRPAIEKKIQAPSFAGKKNESPGFPGNLFF